MEDQKDIVIVLSEVSLADIPPKRRKPTPRAKVKVAPKGHLAHLFQRRGDTYVCIGCAIVRTVKPKGTCVGNFIVEVRGK